MIDKQFYGPSVETDLHQRFQQRELTRRLFRAAKLTFVLATVLGEVEFGYRIIVASEALCSMVGNSYDSMISVLKQRFIQIEAQETEKIMFNWP